MSQSVKESKSSIRQRVLNVKEFYEFYGINGQRLKGSTCSMSLNVKGFSAL